MDRIDYWLTYSPTWITGLLLFLSMVAASLLGARIRARRKKTRGDGEEDGGNRESYVVTAVLGLLALLLGFTFSISVDRFETRRALVLQEANAIGTSYLRAQLLDEPHRTRMSNILRDYTENRVLLAQTPPTDERQKLLLDKSDALLVDLWAATAASFDSIRNLDFSSALVETVNDVIDNDSARKAARLAHVPTGVFVALFGYILVSAAMLGFVLEKGGQRPGIMLFLVLLSISMLLIIDIDKPTTGLIRESQAPMIQLRDNLRRNPPGTYDRWRGGRAPSHGPEAAGTTRPAP